MLDEEGRLRQSNFPRTGCEDDDSDIELVETAFFKLRKSPRARHSLLLGRALAEEERVFMIEDDKGSSSSSETVSTTGSEAGHSFLSKEGHHVALAFI